MKLGRSATKIHPDSFQIAESPREFGAANPRMGSGVGWKGTRFHLGAKDGVFWLRGRKSQPYRL